MTRFAGFFGGITLALALVWTPAAFQNQGGTISGVVIAEGGPDHSEPLPGATVALTNGRQAQNTSTDERGEFAFPDLAPGRYRITVTKAGYRGTELGAFKPGEEGTPIEVEGPRGTAHVMAQLPYPAVLTGTVLDEDGRPVVDATIVTRTAGSENPDVLVLGPVRTDLSGRFRTQLASEETSLTVIDTNLQRPLRTVTYFPGTADPGRAERLKIESGEERELPPMKLVRADARITGVATLPDGRPAAGAMFKVQNAWDRVTNGATDALGRFDVTVAAGKYDVTVTTLVTFTSDETRRTSEMLPQPTGWATTQVEAASGRTVSVTLALKPTASLSGKVISDTEGVLPPDTIVALKTNGRSGAMGVTLTSQFELQRITPGSYEIALQVGPESPWWLKRATANGQSILAGPLALSPGQRITNAELVVSQDRGELSGRITGRNGLPQTDYWVAAITLDDSVRNRESAQVVRTRPATNGRFLFERLPAGEYALALFGDLGAGEWRTPAILRSLVAGGIKVTVPPGTPVVQDVRVER